MTNALNTDALDVTGMAPAEAAARWLVRLDRSVVSEADRCAFDEWRNASNANAEAFEKAQQSWDFFSEDIQGDQHVRALRKAALGVRPEKKIPAWAAIAASFLAVASITLVATHPFRKNPTVNDTHIASNGSTTDIDKGLASESDLTRLGVPDYVTKRGQRLVQRLADGTEVTLNTETEIDVAYTDDKRFIKMTSGQAFFEVAKNPKRPFIVEVGDRQITALGTAFDVKFGDEKIEVVLEEGTISVEQNLPDESEDQILPEPVIMTAGQELVAEIGDAPRIETVDVVRELLWREGRVEFVDETIASAVAEMNRYTSRPIVIRDQRVADLRFTFGFKTSNPDIFTETLSEFFPVAVDHSNPDETVLLWVGD